MEFRGERGLDIFRNRAVCAQKYASVFIKTSVRVLNQHRKRCYCDT